MMRTKLSLSPFKKWLRSVIVPAGPGVIIPGKWVMYEYYSEPHNELLHIEEELLKKENIVLIFDVAGYLDSLDYVKKLDGIIVPSHSDVTDDIRPLVNINKEKINEIINFLLSILDEYRTMEDIIALTLTHYNIIVSFNKYLLMGSTIRSYIAYLSNRGLLDKKFVENKLLFIKKATQK